MARGKHRRPPALRELQRLQARFDKDRGFDFPGATGRGGVQLSLRGLETQDDPGREAVIRQLEYSALALGGEVGELANAVKKARRALWQGESPDEALAQAQHEAADVLAYLLKLTSLFQRDLDRLYLEKMAWNCLRFPSRVGAADGGRIISIAGPSGAGKSTVARALSKRFPTYLEAVDENHHLALLLEGSADFDAFSNQLWFLTRLRQFVRQADPARPVVFDQDPVGVVHVYARMFLDEGRMESAEYTQLVARLLRLESDLARWPGRRMVILLDAPAEVLHERARGRDGGAAPPRSWFAAVRERFQRLREHLPDALVLRTDELSVEEVLARVNAAIAEALAPR